MSKPTLRAAGSLTSGLMLAVRGVGPKAPATKRGLSGVLYLSQASRASRAAVDPALLSQTEVLRGPASTIHGSAALAGVVNFQTIGVDDLLVRAADFPDILELRIVDAAGAVVPRPEPW